MNLPARIAEKIKVTDDCWLWLAAKNRRGYGVGWFDGVSGSLAHRSIYRMLVGPIPEGHHLHHRETCPHHCVNPAHLTPITRRDHCRLHPDNAQSNWERLRSETCCQRGHEFTSENTYVDSEGFRNCRTCKRDMNRVSQRVRRARVKEAALSRG